jgi:class 3 adenylate cyclase
MEGTLICGCGHGNRPEARFCAACGTPMQARCASCGHELEADAQFCDTCGTRVAGAGAETRKTVTVVFADLVGSTALQASLDPESVRHVMGRFYA